jgi:SAM-dependent methyltransferase
MDSPDSRKAHVGDSRPGGFVLRDRPAGLPGHRLPPAESADGFATAEMFRTPNRKPRPDGPEPYSLAWFEKVEKQRYARHGSWIPRLLEFHKHAGETILGLGDCLGTDWTQFARHGSRVVVCTQSSDHLALCRRNFELRGLSGQFVHAPPACLPLADSSVDVVCLSGLFGQPAEPGEAVAEVYRVLRPGGKVLAAAPSRYDVEYFRGAFLPWVARRGETRKSRQWKFSGRKFRECFPQFSEHKLFKRQLRRSDLPHIWRWMPLPLMERLIGRTLIVKAFKPLSAAMPLAVAA